MTDKRRVIFCTYPSLYSIIVLNELLKSPDLELVGVVISTRVISKCYGIIRGSLRHIQLSGLRYAGYLFSVTSLFQIACCLLRKATLKDRLNQQHIPYVSTKDINESEAVEFIKALKPDILISAHFNQLTKKDVLALPTLACINIHPSLLPRLQGVDPAFYALLRKVPETGVTIHFQSDEFDKGNMLEQIPLTLRRQDSLLLLNVKLFKLGAIHAVKQIKLLKKGEQGKEQTGVGQYDSWPNPYDTKLFRRQHRYFSWSEYWKLIRNL